MNRNLRNVNNSRDNEIENSPFMDFMNAFFSTPNADEDTDLLMPRIDMKETKDALKVKSSMPGVDPNNIKISVENGVLTIDAEMKKDTEEKSDEKDEKGEKPQYLIHEHSYSSYYREIDLPTDVDSDKAEAEYKDGILYLTLPKVKVSVPKMISVKSSK